MNRQHATLWIEADHLIWLEDRLAQSRDYHDAWNDHGQKKDHHKDKKIAQMRRITPKNRGNQRVRFRTEHPEETGKHKPDYRCKRAHKKNDSSAFYAQFVRELGNHRLFLSITALNRKSWPEDLVVTAFFKQMRFKTLHLAF